jgi:cyclic pyranopterin monophosphate synthase
MDDQTIAEESALTHFDDAGRARMVDVGGKDETERIAVASGRVTMRPETVVAAAALTIYDMLKAVDRGMMIESIQLERKEGGRSGLWLRDARGDEGGG